MATPPGTPCNQWIAKETWESFLHTVPPDVATHWPTPIYQVCQAGALRTYFYFDPRNGAWYWELAGAPPGTNTLSVEQRAIIEAHLAGVTPPACEQYISYADCQAMQEAFPWWGALAAGAAIAALAWVAVRRQAPSGLGSSMAR